MAKSFTQGLKSWFSGESQPAAGKPVAKPAGSSRDQVLAAAKAQIRASQERVMTPERAELIRKALEVRQAKQAILADLDDEQRQKLVALAFKKLLNEGKSEK